MIGIGSAIGYLTDFLVAPAVKGLPNLISDIFEYTVFGVLILVALMQRTPKEGEISTAYRAIAIALASLLSLGAVYGFMWFFLFPSMTQDMLTSVGISTSLSGIVVLLGIAYILMKRRYAELSLDVGFFTSACLLMTVSLGLLAAELFLVSDFWIYAETLQIAAYLLITIAVCIPFLRNIGFSRLTAYLLVLTLNVLTYLPFTITISIEAASSSVPPDSINTLAFAIIHFGVASLSVMMGFLLYTYSKRQPSRNLHPLILLFVLWAEIAAVTVFFVMFPGLAPRGEPIVPYLVGSIVTIPLLFLAIRWTARNHEEPKPLSSWALLLGAVTLMAAVLVGEMGNQLVLAQYELLAGSPFSNSLLLLMNLIVIFAITYLLFIQAELSRGRTSIEVYVVLFLSMWIVPNVLKSYYDIWSSGWWVSEILIFIALLSGPAFLGLLYVRAMRDAEESHSKASLYADLLMHDISNYHQMLLTAVELLGEEDASQSQRERLSGDAYHVISLAEQLITNVRLITESESLSEASLAQMNLMETLVDAMDRVMRIAGGKGVKLQLMPFSAQANVLGSSLLKHVFINIVHSVLLQPLEAKVIQIEIQPRSEMGVEFWEVRIHIPDWWIEIQSEAAPSKSEEDFSGSALGILVSRLVTESLGGTLTVVRKMDEPGMGSSFVVNLPSYRKPE
jgi:signal transduction histidine kinase